MSSTINCPQCGSSEGLGTIENIVISKKIIGINGDDFEYADEAEEQLDGGTELVGVGCSNCGWSNQCGSPAEPKDFIGLLSSKLGSQQDKAYRIMDVVQLMGSWSAIPRDARVYEKYTGGAYSMINGFEFFDSTDNRPHAKRLFVPLEELVEDWPENEGDLLLALWTRIGKYVTKALSDNEDQ